MELRGFEPLTSSMPSTASSRDFGALSVISSTAVRLCTPGNRHIGKQIGKRFELFDLRGSPAFRPR